jgi:hypothetical protein
MNEKDELPEIPAWILLDEVVRKWVALSGFEKDQEDYKILKEKHD